MQVIIDFFVGLKDGIVSVFQWFADLLSDLAYIAKLLGEFLVSIPSYFTWIPAEALVILVAIFSIVAIYKLAGREG